MVGSKPIVTFENNGFCMTERPDPCGLVIFGASGDLTSRKLIPAIYQLFNKKFMGSHFYIIGCARTELSTDEFRKKIESALMELNYEPVHIHEFLTHCFYTAGDYHSPDLYKRLKKEIKELNQTFQCRQNVLFYMATPPYLYVPITEGLTKEKLPRETIENRGFRRFVYEKPYGRDLESAIQLDRDLNTFLSEHQIYRIDHYLGKETVQNILMFRFANSIVEPVWNHHYIDHVQITVAESLGVGHRAGYYDQSGQLRDMFQNHMLQLLSLIAIEQPSTFAADQVRDEKVKVLRAIEPFVPCNSQYPCIIRGQYQAGKINGEMVSAYLDEKGTESASQTESYLAARVYINNWRWKEVPFYLRTGKRLKSKVTQIAIVFKSVPHSMFYPLKESDLANNILLLNVQPDEGISLKMQAKMPGTKICMTSVKMEFNYRDILGGKVPEPYERLLLDCMIGDQTLFWRYDGVELAWQLVTPVIDWWKTNPEECPLFYYPAGSQGPIEAENLLKLEGRQWLPI
ncbi:MAG: glucose-6-phosphate dehydrogenase [Spirochaetes bacterium]|nr:glucose-6-phosphate dehydrogenase [Spirochaetota bacterium]